MYKTKKERIKEAALIILCLVALGAMFLLSSIAGSRGLEYRDSSISLKEGVWIFLILLGSYWIYKLTDKLRDIEDRVKKLESNSK